MTSVVTWRYVENKINLTFNVGVVLWGGGLQCACACLRA